MSLLPFWAIYLISDFIYFPLYYVARYRRKVVRKNLTNSFPEKTEKEIIRIEKRHGLALLSINGLNLAKTKMEMTFLKR